MNICDLILNKTKNFVLRVGIEPTLCYQNWILNPARLPVPPPKQGVQNYKNFSFIFNCTK